MNLGKCATCGYVNESATAFCSRADCALELCGVVSAVREEMGFVRHPCTLPRGHEGSHRANGERWMPVALDDPRPVYETGYRGRAHCGKCGVENTTGPEARAVTGWPLHCGVRMAEGCR